LISGSDIPAWRASSFLLGLLLIWAALGSPVASYDHELLTFHMIQHLLLMTFAPALIFLGAPLHAVWHGMPQSLRNALGIVFERPLVRRFAHVLTRPALCWGVSALTLIGWHIPTLFTLGLRSEAWHAVEQASFFGAGLLFWWPVLRPWPSSSPRPQWSILLYLFLATLPCDILSGFLVFSERIAYPVYLSTSRRFGLSVLADQQCAGALMWTCVTVVYLVPATILTIRLLTAGNSQGRESVHSKSHGMAASRRNPQGVEVL
jgi:cytochrome c oxidase assembly factor CtaG